MVKNDMYLDEYEFIEKSLYAFSYEQRPKLSNNYLFISDYTSRLREMLGYSLDKEQSYLVPKYYKIIYKKSVVSDEELRYIDEEIDRMKKRILLISPDANVSSCPNYEEITIEIIFLN